MSILESDEYKDLSEKISDGKDLLYEVRQKIGLKTRYREYDPLCDATNGKHHWHEPGMSNLELTDEENEMFCKGARVQIRKQHHRGTFSCCDTWLNGTIVETAFDNDRSFVIKCDEKIHNNESFYDGHGVTLMYYMCRRRWILSQIRLLENKEEI